MGTVKAFMEVTPWVRAYFAFGLLHNMGNVNKINQLLGPSGWPTDLGWYYLN
jgi:hypothetical protein